MLLYLSNTGSWERALLGKNNDAAFPSNVALHQILVNHVGQEALHFVHIHGAAAAAHGYRHAELGNRHTGAAHWRRLAVLELIEATGDENLSQKIA